MADQNERTTHIQRTDAQAGEKSGVVRYILGISLVLVIVLFAVIVMM